MALDERLVWSLESGVPGTVQLCSHVVTCGGWWYIIVMVYVAAAVIVTPYVGSTSR